jgi:hypothetical protein
MKSIIISCVLVLALLVGRAMAQFEDDVMIAYGAIESITGETFVLNLDDDLNEQDIEAVTFTLTDETVFENVDNRDALKVGQDLEVVYMLEGDVSKVVSIYIFDLLTDDDAEIPSLDEAVDNNE